MKSAHFVLFFVMVLALQLLATNAQFTITATNDCGTNCIIGTPTQMTVAISTSFPSLLYSSSTTPVTQLDLAIPIPYNSTMPSECELRNANDGVITSGFTPNIVAIDGAPAWRYATFSFNNAVLGQMTTANLRCPIDYPTMATADGLEPFNSLTYAARVNGNNNVAFTIPLPTAGKTYADCAATPTVNCGGAAWSAGAGLDGYLTLQVQIPAGIDQYDQLSFQNFPNLGTLSNCRVGQSPADVAGNSLITSGAANTDSDLGYLPVSCQGTIPAASSTPTTSTTTVTFNRLYWGSPKQRFTSAVKIPSPVVSTIGAYAGSQNDAKMTIFPLAATAVGNEVSLQLTTTNFNSAFQYTVTPTGLDDGSSITQKGRVELTYNVDPDFLEIIPNSSSPRQCSFTNNARDSNYPGNSLSFESETISGSTVTVRASVNIALPYTSTIGQTIRIFCSGFRIKGAMTLPYNPTGSVALKMFSKTGSEIGKSPSTGFLFSTVTKETSAEPVDWAFHNLAIHVKGLLMNDQMNQVISTYRSVLKLPSSAIVRISNQVFEPKNNLLRVAVAIRGTAIQPTSDIVNSLSAQTATTIANNIANQWSINQLASQSPATKVVIPGHCNNQLKDEDETAVDCGGKDCLGCVAQSSACVSNSDCSTGKCEESICAINNNANGATFGAVIIIVALCILRDFF